MNPSCCTGHAAGELRITCRPRSMKRRLFKPRAMVNWLHRLCFVAPVDMNFFGDHRLHASGDKCLQCLHSHSSHCRRAWIVTDDSSQSPTLSFTHVLQLRQITETFIIHWHSVFIFCMNSNANTSVHMLRKATGARILTR